jgi:hypothetical protein
VRILLIGLPAPGRLEAVNHALGRISVEAEFDAVHSIAGFRDSPAAVQTPPDLILVFQDWPEQYTPREADWLLSQCSLSRILCVYGGWCEADGRTRSVWPHAVRVPQWRLRDRLRREFEVMTGGSAPLPLTASRREKFLFEHQPEPEAADTARHAVRIVTPDRALDETLSAFLGVRGPSVALPDVILFDVDPWDAETEAELQGFAGHYPRARLIALAGFPNHVPVDDIRASGASAVLPKLLTAHELAEILQDL